MRIFLSYCSDDYEFARDLSAYLSSKSIFNTVFFAPEQIPPGHRWIPKLAEEVSNSDAFVIMIGTRVSGWQQIEYNEAFSRHVEDSKLGAGAYPIIPVFLARNSSNLAFLNQFQLIDAVTLEFGEVASKISSALSGTIQNPSVDAWKLMNPYKGLAPLSEQDGEFFFGRNEQTQEILKSIAQAPEYPVTLIGNSGVGKSSLARAGVIGALRRENFDHGISSVDWPRNLQNSRKWSYKSINATDDPLRALVKSFAIDLFSDATDPKREQWILDWTKITNSEMSACNLVDAFFEKTEFQSKAEPARVFLLIDHFESLFFERNQNINSFEQIFSSLIEDPRVILLINVRSDYYGHLQNCEFWPVLEPGIVNVAPPDSLSLEEILRKPAEILDVKFESEDLIERVIDQLDGHNSALPLLSDFMTNVWVRMQHRGDGILKTEDRHKGVHVAAILTERANAFLDANIALQSTIRNIFTRKLCRVSAEGKPMRRRVRRTECNEEEWLLIEKMAGQQSLSTDPPFRILVIGYDEGEIFAEVSHDVLFEKWDALQDWLKEQWEFLIWHSKVEHARENWESLQEDNKHTGLLTGLLLAESEKWMEKRRSEIDNNNAEYIYVSNDWATDKNHSRKILKQYSVLLDIPIPFAIVNKDKEFVYFNQKFNQEFLNGEAAGGNSLKNFLSNFSSDDQSAFARGLSAVFSGTENSDPMIFGLEQQPDINCSICITGNNFGGGEVGEALITVQKESAKTEQDNDSIRAQKMQAVGQLAGGIAHDFNNVLTAIIGFSDLLLSQHTPSDPSFHDIMNIKQNANRAASLVRQLLAFSRRQVLVPRPLELEDVISDLRMLLNSLVGDQIQIKVRHERDLWHIKADISQLEQVIVNLAVNSRDAMPDGGTLEIQTSNYISDENAAVGQPGDKFVCLKVSDTGTGIEHDILNKIFDPFFSTKEVGKGTGFGLSTVYGIVKQSGGFIDVESEVGNGTSFYIYLPQSELSQQEYEKRQAEINNSIQGAEYENLTGEESILLVEDEAAVRAFGSRALSSRGYNVIEAANGLEAIEAFSNPAADIDLVVADVVMPYMDGLELIKTVRSRFGNVPFVLVTGYSTDAVSKELENKGIENFSFLPKPFSLKQLAIAVKRTFEKLEAVEIESDVSEIPSVDRGSADFGEVSKGTQPFSVEMDTKRDKDTSVASLEKPIASQHRILLIDDDEIIREAISRLISSKGYNIEQASDGVHALNLIEERTEKFDLIITDVFMPNMDGPTFYERLLDIYDNPNVIFMSSVPEALENRLPNSKSYRFLNKPIEEKALSELVHEAIQVRPEDHRNVVQILVSNDEKTNQSAKELMNESGFRYLASRSGLEILEYFSYHDCVSASIYCETNLADMDWLMFLEECERREFRVDSLITTKDHKISKTLDNHSSILHETDFTLLEAVQNKVSQ